MPGEPRPPCCPPRPPCCPRRRRGRDVSCELAKQPPNTPVDTGAARRYLPLLLVLFAASGCSALIYEIVWYQLLQLVIGSSAVSLGVLLATFMGGLCLGSLALPRLRMAGEHPLRVYGKLELGIAFSGVLVLFGMPLVDSVYTAAVGHGLPAILLRALVASLCLLPPTFLMGAVLGCLLAGFYLLRVFDMATATCVAALTNVAVALGSFALAHRTAANVEVAEAAAALGAVLGAAPVAALGAAPVAVLGAAPAAVSKAWPVYVTIGL